MHRRPVLFLMFLAMLVPVVAWGQNPCTQENTTRADVVALDQAFYNNRLGAFQSGGTIYALRHDVESNSGGPSTLMAGKVMLRRDKRPRPIVLRVNANSCLEIAFQNLLADVPQVSVFPAASPWEGKSTMTNAWANGAATPALNSWGTTNAQGGTRYAGVHVMGLSLVRALDGNGTPIEGISADGSWSGANDITANASGPRASGLIAPGQRITYVLHAPPHSEGSYLLYSTGATNGASPNMGGQLMQGLFGSVTVQPARSEWYRSQVTRAELLKATYKAAGQQLTRSSKAPVKINGKNARVWNWAVAAGDSREAVLLDAGGDPVTSGTDGYLHTTKGQPYINYGATDDARRCGNEPMPVLKMTNSRGEICHSDLTAIITGPNAGLVIDPPYAGVPSTPNPREPWREFAIHYHDDFLVTQAFPQQQSGASLAQTLTAGRDFFAINYGMGGIAAEVLANRLGVGPMYQCATCKFEEFFLSAWTVGDPAMVVDVPANQGVKCTTSGDCTGSTLGPKATKALYPDDPSNVYHSYVGDHVIFQILHAGTNITHVHHMHAQQWLHSPRNPNGAYRDSQMISPGASYTLNHVYNGSGNVNKTVGDSIFHCHFYPHFAQGMWSLWRVHDALETGTTLNSDGTVRTGWNRALPDGEIASGTPTPALVPLPTIPMALPPARTQIVSVTIPTEQDPVGYTVQVHPDDKTRNPGYPFYIPGVAGQRAPHPPLDLAWDEDANGNPRKDSSGKTVYLDGGLPRHISLFDPDITEKHTRWDFTKNNGAITAVQLPEDGTAGEKAAMAIHEVRNHPSFTPEGRPAPFVLNGMKRKHGAPYANPNVTLDGREHCREEERPPLVLDPKDGRQPCLIRYKAANIQIDAVFNKKGWHYPQTRILTLWGDVKDTMENKRIPQPFFFRANSDQIIEYWQANLVPNYYELDDFQVRTPTDVIGQHIHLVKFDVTSSDGAGNGYNYEDGTFSPDEVRETIGAINQCPGGHDCTQCPAGLFAGLSITNSGAKPTGNRTCLRPKAIPYFGDGPGGRWLGAQATIQRWAADPVFGEAQDEGLLEYPKGERRIDRTLRTVFTHDHFGPSTHQQVGLYAGLVVEPRGSYWLDGETGEHYGSNANRPTGANNLPPLDGGPTGWHANIIDPRDPDNSYREFVLEFQDRQLAYTADSIGAPVPYDGGTPAYTGWSDPKNAISPPGGTVGPLSPRPPFPVLVTNTFGTGSYSVNYRNEPLTFRAFGGTPSQTPNAAGSDLSNAFASIVRLDPQLNVQPAGGTKISSTGANAFTFAPAFRGAQPTDPYTPLLRAYGGDNVQVRTLVGAHMSPHFFNMHGVNWLFEPAEEDSGWRSAQGMGISEHYEMIFTLPKNSGPTADFLWEASSDTTGRKNGNWGLLRAYDQNQPDLQRLPNNASGAGAAPAGCPSADIAPVREYRVRAMTIQQATGTNWLTYNARGQAGANGGQQLVDPSAIIYVDEADLVNGKLRNPNRVEPLILRAKAGECVTVTLTNDLPAGTAVGNTVTTIPAWPAQFTVNAASKTEGDQWIQAFSGPSPFYAQSFQAAFNAQNGLGYALADPSGNTANNGNQTYTITANNTTAVPKQAGTKFIVSRAGDTAFTVVASQPVAISTSRNVGLHASLLQYDVRDSDGMNIGANPVQTLAAGQSKTYRWYAGQYVLDNNVWTPRPVEYGSVNLNPSDPLMQHPKGLIGALIIEPRTTTSWTVDENSKASARVVYTDDGVTKSFREFVTIISDDIIGMQTTGNVPPQAAPPAGGSGGTSNPATGGTGTGNPATPAAHTISGVVVNGVIAWSLNGTQQPNDAVYTVAPGDTVIFNVVNGRHGVAFTPGKAAFDAFFDVVSGGELLKDSPNGITGSWGTDAFPGPKDLVTLRVKSNATGTLPFLCTQHKAAMAGTLRVNAPAPSTVLAGDVVNGQVVWALNGVPQANNSTYNVKPGDIITVTSQTGLHGIAFLQGQAAFEAFFNVLSGGNLLVANPNGIAGSWGTLPQTGPVTLLTLQVKPTATGTLPFECSQHKQNMAGTFRISTTPTPTHTITGDIVNGTPTWLLDGKPMANNSNYSIKPGDVILFNVKSGTHGVTFTQGQAAFNNFFTVLEGAGKLIANPNGITGGWGTPAVAGPATLITIQAKSNAAGSLIFWCTQHKQNMAGTFTAGPQTLNITGDNAPGPVWKLNGTVQANNAVYRVNSGDTAVFSVAAGRHGVAFITGRAAFESVFEVVSADKPLKNDPNGIAGSWGTDAFTGPTALITVRVKPNVQPTNLPFWCTQHKAGMAGTFQVNGGVPTLSPAPAAFTRAFNYRTEPLQYRFVDQSLFLSPQAFPLGIMRAMSNQLVLADPQTPVFAAAAGEPVRIRMLHPAGLDEQVLTLHGHHWQEEPYENGTASSVIGHNRFSQLLGSRDAFGPNVSWDLVIDEAGGHARTQGDYLFRTFIGTDFLNGLWGILRVGEKDRDIVTVNYFPAPGAGANFPSGLRGTTTANTSNGRMADFIEIYAGLAGTGAPFDRVRIDKETGFWSSTKTMPNPPLFVQSVKCNDASCSSTTPWGSRLVAAHIPTTTAPAGAAAQPMINLPPSPVDLFKPTRTDTIVRPEQSTTPPTHSDHPPGHH